VKYHIGREGIEVRPIDKELEISGVKKSFLKYEMIS